MASLERNLRKDLENAVKKARRVAEAGARQAIEQLAVHHHEPWPTLSQEQKELRNRLRAHARQLGDRRDERAGSQAIEKLVDECAYEQWHRLLFARFLAENDLLVEPDSGVPLSLEECRELARERGVDWVVLASGLAERMLPQIFRAGDPVLEIRLPPEKRQELESILSGLPAKVFTADDSLGWVYQFWQSDEKDKVNDSGKKIGADDLAAVTQLFTEDYMVLFLLHNTLGAWWAGKVLAARPDLARAATSEDELRAACALPGVDWEYLRFVKSTDDTWRPAAGTFEGFPSAARDITVLDPCMGSGHFLVFALRILVAFRMAEEGFSRAPAVDAVLRDNLFGLEIDPRCTQIAAFNVAFAAWRFAGHHALPALSFACSGLSPSARKGDWVSLGGPELRFQGGMEHLYKLFEKAADLGSLINPHALKATLLQADFRELAPLFERAIENERADDDRKELAVAALGITRAAAILARRFTLVTTNVPYLGRSKHDSVLKEYCEREHPAAKADLATCFVERCLEFCTDGSTVAVLTPQNWLFLGGYKRLRERLLETDRWNFVARLGPRAFETITGEIVSVAMLALTRGSPSEDHKFAGLDLGAEPTPGAKREHLSDCFVVQVNQRGQLNNPDMRVTFDDHRTGISLLSKFAECYQGVRTGDRDRFVCSFWEVTDFTSTWEPFRNTSTSENPADGITEVIRWESGQGTLHTYAKETREKLHDMHESGNRAWGKRGVAINQMSSLRASFFFGEKFDGNVNVVFPADESLLPAVWAFCSSPEYEKEVRRLDKKLAVTNATLIKVPFDLTHWQAVAATAYTRGLPEAESKDPTQWFFHGRPGDSDRPLHVAVARLLGHRWPRQIGAAFISSSHIADDILERRADDDGIVCLMPLKGEAGASDRLRAVLAERFGPEWSAGKLAQLLDAVRFGDESLDTWLRDGFFEQHCDLFHQRPFVWHIWDGLKNGFGALINYHKLAAPNGEGRRTLEKLIYTYLGDWIDRQRADQAAGVEGADARVAAAEHLKRELEKILEGEPPYDVFVRWKPLHEQPIGWDPDLNDGVRLNIRPFMTAKPLSAKGKNACILRVAPKIKWDKDRGKEPHRAKEEYPWFWKWDGHTEDFAGGAAFDGNRWNDPHYSRAAKLAARERKQQGDKS